MITFQGLGIPDGFNIYPNHKSKNIRTTNILDV